MWSERIIRQVINDFRFRVARFFFVSYFIYVFFFSVLFNSISQVPVVNRVINHRHTELFMLFININ